jgi:hypothetical protein
MCPIEPTANASNLVRDNPPYLLAHARGHNRGVIPPPGPHPSLGDEADSQPRGGRPCTGLTLDNPAYEATTVGNYLLGEQSTLGKGFLLDVFVV